MEKGAIVFVLPVAEAGMVGDTTTLSSDGASLRLRAFPAIRAVAHLRPTYVFPPHLLDNTVLNHAGTVVVTKFATAALSQSSLQFEQLIHWLTAAQGKGLKLFADFSDNYSAYNNLLSAPNPIFDFYQKGLGATCVLTCPTQALRQELEPIARNGIHVIEDPYESQENAQVYSGCDRLCWFGTLNMKTAAFTFAKILHAMREAGREAKLTFVTSTSRKDCVESLASELSIAIRFVSWSLDGCWQAIRDSHLVLLPQVDDEWGRVKSHNRLVETIRNGRLAIASPIPSYQELADYCWLGHDFAAGVRWAMAHPVQAVDKISAGQKYVRERFAPERIQAKWRELLI